MSDKNSDSDYNLSFDPSIDQFVALFLFFFQKKLCVKKITSIPFILGMHSIIVRYHIDNSLLSYNKISQPTR